MFYRLNETFARNQWQHFLIGMGGGDGYMLYVMVLLGAFLIRFQMNPLIQCV